MQFTKYLDYLETLAKETGKRTLCEAVADAAMASDVGLKSTLVEYMVDVGTEFRNMVLGMGRVITEYAVNEAFKKNSDYVFRAFETGVSPATVAAKLYGDALTVPPKASYVEPVHYMTTGNDGAMEKRQFTMESVTGTISDYVKKHALAMAISAAIGATGAVGIPKSIDAAGDMKKAAHEYVAEATNESQAIGQVARWNLSGENIGSKKGWKYVDYKDRPGIYGPHFKGVQLSDLDGETSPITHEPLRIGWWVSPDGREVFSTVTGKYFKLDRSFLDDGFIRDDLGKEFGVGARYVLPDDDCYDWDLDKYYGKGNW